MVPVDSLDNLRSVFVPRDDSVVVVFEFSSSVIRCGFAILSRTV